MVEIKIAGLKDLTASEGQQLAGQRAGLLSGIADLLQIFIVPLLAREISHGQVDVPYDPLQKVVKVV